MGSYDFNKEQRAWLRGVYILDTVCMTCMLSFALFNLFKYVVKLRDRSILVLLFYAGVFLAGTAYIIVYVDLSINVGANPFIYDTPGLQLVEFCVCVGSCTTLAINWLICATMYQLTVSIRVVIGKMRNERA